MPAAWGSSSGGHRSICSVPDCSTLLPVQILILSVQQWWQFFLCPGLASYLFPSIFRSKSLGFFFFFFLLPFLELTQDSVLCSLSSSLGKLCCCSLGQWGSLLTTCTRLGTGSSKAHGNAGHGHTIPGLSQEPVLLFGVLNSEFGALSLQKQVVQTALAKNSFNLNCTLLSNADIKFCTEGKLKKKSANERISRTLLLDNK